MDSQHPQIPMPIERDQNLQIFIPEIGNPANSTNRFGNTLQNNNP